MYSSNRETTSVTPLARIPRSSLYQFAGFVRCPIRNTLRSSRATLGRRTVLPDRRGELNGLMQHYLQFTRGVSKPKVFRGHCFNKLEARLKLGCHEVVTSS